MLTGLLMGFVIGALAPFLGVYIVYRRNEKLRAQLEAEMNDD